MSKFVCVELHAYAESFATFITGKGFHAVVQAFMFHQAYIFLEGARTLITGISTFTQMIDDGLHIFWGIRIVVDDSCCGKCG